MLERNNQIEIARLGAYWNPKIPDHISGGIINYPVGLNQENEGSRAVFLFVVLYKLNDTSPVNEDVGAIHTELQQAKQDAINCLLWNPTLEDIS